MPDFSQSLGCLTPENIQKCFSKAGFVPYVECEPESYTEPPPLQNIWDNLQCVLGVNGPFAEYAIYDNRVESSEKMDDAAIIEAVASECETVAVDENEDPDASDSDEGAVEGDDTREAREEEIIKTSTEFLCIIAQQKAYILRNKLPKNLFKELSNIENAIVASKAKSCNTQTKLLSFFHH